ncbi:phage portal protein [Paracoccus aestuarii]|uniref:Phage portal protein n=1 Tax=Paracoccus aestuarii TaxID=453842 RepID=A0A419A2E7_9RHOB|nr:phage portal protein [Paracoccus aestuarii]RJL07154.1 phage portal protein [Paracoccus aestuarii]WCQ99564.1 phage portal protein [Paracoccus aestuarii]
MGILSRLISRRVDQPRQVRMLEGASGKRWPSTPAFGATGGEVLAGAAQVRGRARHLRFNDPTATNAAEILRTALVGYGATLTSGEEVVDTAFADWAADTRLASLEGEMIDSLATDGEALIVLRSDNSGALRLQHVPAEQLDESYSVELGGGRYIAAGIEYDTDDQPAAYHFRPARPTDQYQTFRAPVRVDAVDVLHIFRRQGAGQTRGLSWFAPVILPLNELSQLQDALQVTAKIQAMMCGFLIDQNGTATSPLAEGESPLDVSLEPGTMRVLPAGWDVKFTTPQQMAQSVELVAVSLRQIAAGLQMPEFLLSGDMRGVNYSSARTALIQFRSRIEAVQHSLLVPAFYAPIWRRWHLLESLRGGDWADPTTPLEVHFPKPQWVDPESDAKATREMLAMGLISRRQAVAQLGYDVAKVDAEIAADRQRETAMGLTFGENQTEQNGIQA